MPRLNVAPPVLGIICMAVGTMVLTTHDAISKWLLQTLHTGEIIAIRGLLSLPIVLVLARLEGHGWRDLRSRAPWQTGLRGVFALLTSVLVILSFKYMPLADALAIIFSSPLMVTAMSATMLHEPVGWRRWTATCTGFAGALLIVGPRFDTVGVWALVPVAAALTSAFRDIMTRRLGFRDTGPSILFWTMVVSALGGVASLPVMGMNDPGPGGWSLLAATAVLIAVAFRLNIAAFKLASGAVVAPLRYLSLVWAAVLGYAFWSDVPNLQAIAGAALIMGAGLYTLRREARLAARGA